MSSALCFGWIDGIAKRYSETVKAQRLTPRRKRSNWKELICEQAGHLIRLGLMTPAGEATLPDLTIGFELADEVESAIKAEDGAR